MAVSLEFLNESAVTRLERYLKSGSGRGFAKRHFSPDHDSCSNPEHPVNSDPRIAPSVKFNIYKHLVAFATRLFLRGSISQPNR
jgi:hypothetical protein